MMSHTCCGGRGEGGEGRGEGLEVHSLMLCNG